MPANTNIAAQLYTLREFIKTPADIATTLKRVKKLGYDAVQLSALGPIDPKELAGMLTGEGLICAATHTSLARMKVETQAVIDEHKLWDCRYTAIGGYFPTEPSLADWKRFAAEYSEAAQKFAGSGVSVGYHNHSHELAHFERKSILQLLLETLPKEVWYEIDTYWITHGGGDPVAWIDKVGGRIPCVHFKDMVVNPKREQLMCEVGEGNLNWPGIIAACKRAGVAWYIVEQDDTYGKDPFECLGTSLRNLKQMGLS